MSKPKKTAVIDKTAVTVTKAAKPIGTLRVSSKAVAKTALQVITESVNNTDIIKSELPKAIAVAKTAKLKNFTAYTPFGHDNKPSMARAIDLQLLKCMNTGKVDVIAFMSSIFSEFTTTSKCTSKKPTEQVDFTFKKVKSHLNGFADNNHFKNNMFKRMTKQSVGYTAIQAKTIAVAFYPLASMIRKSVANGHKAYNDNLKAGKVGLK